MLVILTALFKPVTAYFKKTKPTLEVNPKPIPIVKMTLDEYEARTQAKIDAALAERAAAPNEPHPVKDAQIAELQSRLANSEQSFEKQKQFTASLEARLDREGNTSGGDDVEKAKQALEAGDTEAATRLFENIKARTALDVEASARASFALGEIAEQEVRWHQAFAHFSEAARLHQCFDYLIRAQEMAHNLANYLKAERLVQLSLDAAKKEYGKTSSQYGIGLNNLASLLQAMGRYDEAEPIYRQALENTRQTLGETHPNYGTGLNNLAGLLLAQKRYKKAEPLFKQALEITRQTLGETHPIYGTRLNNLAELLQAIGRFGEAEPLYRQALDNAYHALGEDHPGFATYLNNFASLLVATKRYDEAELFYRQAVKIMDKSLGPEHPNTNVVKQNLEKLLTEHPPEN